MQLVPGTRIGRFTVLRYVATGGMAEIYLVRASGIGGFEKTLVLKRILPDHASDPQFIEMFLDEAKLAAVLDHPNIVHVHDIGEADGSYFFTMEYVRGQTVLALQRAVRRSRRPLPLDAALAIVSGAAAGLHHAHEKKRGGQALGIVHRDVSPSNVLVTFDGGVKVVDFGIAKAAARLTRTSTGTVKGKFGYMSPEQCRGGAIDRRSDIFALGILLFELTTGQTLFAGDNEFAVVHKVCNEPLPRPTAVAAGYPPELEAIVLRALDRDPERRFATARDLELALDGFARDHKRSVGAVMLAEAMRELFGAELIERDLEPPVADPTAATTVANRPRPTRRRWPAVALAGGIAFAAGGGWLLARDRDDAMSPPVLVVPSPPEPVSVTSPPPADPPPVVHADPHVVRDRLPTRVVRRTPPERAAAPTTERVTVPPDAGALDLEGMLPPGK